MRIPLSMYTKTYPFLNASILMLGHAEENGVRHQLSPHLLSASH